MEALTAPTSPKQGLVQTFCLVRLGKANITTALKSAPGASAGSRNTKGSGWAEGPCWTSPQEIRRGTPSNDTSRAPSTTTTASRAWTWRSATRRAKFGACAATARTPCWGKKPWTCAGRIWHVYSIYNNLSTSNACLRDKPSENINPLRSKSQIMLLKARYCCCVWERDCCAAGFLKWA